MYAHTFERFRIFYKENQTLDEEGLRQKEHGNMGSNGALWAAGKCPTSDLERLLIITCKLRAVWTSPTTRM